MASCDREFTIKEMIGKSAVSADDVTIGKITKIIDQTDNDSDDPNKICDIEKDLFQVVVELDPKVFTALAEPMETLFSSQTLSKVVDSGIQLKLAKDVIGSIVQSSLQQ